MGERPAERLLAADEIRAEDVDAAIAIYRQHAASIALSEPVGRDRLRWIIAEGFAYDPRFDDLVREAAAGEGDEDLRRRAGLVLAQHAARARDHAGAHAILLEGFRAEEGRGSLLELATALNLALVCNLLRRDFEALVFARHGSERARRRGAGRPGRAPAPERLDVRDHARDVRRLRGAAASTARGRARYAVTASAPSSAPRRSASRLAGSIRLCLAGR